MVSSRPLKLLVILGPTASGKSHLALALAKQFNGEIINADSRQFYQEMHIGTAKPTAAERASVPHHLVDCASLADPWDVVRFVEAAHVCVREIAARGRLPIVVGGTGLYLRSLQFGVDAIPKIPNHLREQLRAECEQHGLAVQYARLQKLDPVAAQRLSPQDTQRILRALEVMLHTGQPIHEFWQNENNATYQTLRLGLDWPRAQLYQRIDARVQSMLADGLKDEVQSLAKLFPENVILQKTIGYQEWLQFGCADEALVQSEIQKNTRHFAKRQMTWFRKETDIVWQQPDDFAVAQKLVEDFL